MYKCTNQTLIPYKFSISSVFTRLDEMSGRSFQGETFPGNDDPIVYVFSLLSHLMGGIAIPHRQSIPVSFLS